MTKTEFDAALAKTRLKPNTALAAQFVLVDGLGHTDAGAHCNPILKRQQVYEAVERLKQVHRRSTGAPEGWAVLSLVLPVNSEEWCAAEKLQGEAFDRLDKVQK